MKRVIIATLLALSPVVALATTPTISVVSGTVSTGQTLTITGGNMVDHNSTNWQTDFDGTFETGSGSWTAEEAGYTLEGSNHTSCVRSFSTDQKILGAKSGAFALSGAIDSSGGGVGCAVYVWPDRGSDLYISAYQKWDTSSGNGSWPDNFIKVFLSGMGSQLYSQFVNYEDPPTKWIASVAHNPGDSEGTIPGGSFKDGAWYHIETRIKNTTPRVLQVWIDGQLIINDTPGEAAALDVMIIGVPNLAETYAGFGMVSYVDQFVLSSSRVYPSSKIEIADGNTYATATKVYQEPIALADGTVQIKANLTGLGGGPYYLFVTNNKQEVSSAYALDGGSETPTTSTSIGVGTMQIGAGTTTITVQ